MNKIIALQGVGDSGKTTTIGLARDLLLRNGWKEVRYVRGSVSTKDFAVVLQVNKMRVGVCSWGDNEYQLTPCLPEFYKEKCTVIVCALRTRGGTVEYVRKFALSCKFKFEPPSPIPKNREPKNKHQEVSRNLAKKIVGLIEEELSK